jgi:hypothetical protein
LHWRVPEGSGNLPKPTKNSLTTEAQRHREKRRRESPEGLSFLCVSEAGKGQARKAKSEAAVPKTEPVKAETQNPIPAKKTEPRKIPSYITF